MTDPTNATRPWVRAEIRASREAVTISFPAAEGVTGAMTLTLDQLTDVIKGLGMTRLEMVEGKQSDAPAGERADVAPITKLTVQRDPLTGGSAVILDHPMFGLSGFVLPRAAVAKLVRDLSRHLEQAPQTPESRN